MIALQEEPIDPARVLSEVGGHQDGALALFVGTVRDHNAGRRVLHLEYHAYAGMARAELRRIEADALRRYRISRLAVVHRTGRLAVGDCSVAVAVSAPHRGPALEACRFVIETLKRTVPIWKKESFEGGQVWIEGAGESAGPEDEGGPD